MQEIILVKYGEMALKGMNKKTFEDVLVKNIKRRIKSLGKARITRAQSTIYVEPECENFDTAFQGIWYRGTLQSRCLREGFRGYKESFL